MSTRIERGPVVCNRPGCGKTWQRDPMLEVQCPDCCAAPGRYLVRPSGQSGPFVDGHAARDVGADAAGAYGVCPLGICGIVHQPAQMAFAL